MAEPINVESVVADLSKPENAQELNQTLNDAFKEATTTPAEKAADAQPAENKQPEVANPKGEAPAKAEEPSKDAGEPVKPKSRVETLLEDRNNAKTEAAEKQTEVQTLTKQVETLSALVEKLTSGKGSEADGAGNDDVADDEPMTKKQVDAYLEKKLAEQAEASNSKANAEKSINDQIQALENDKETPDYKEHTENLKAIMAKHPTLTAYAAYKMLQGQGIIPMDGVNVSNANRTGTGTRSKTNLLDSKSATDMSQNDLLSHLKSAEKSGELDGLI